MNAKQAMRTPRLFAIGCGIFMAVQFAFATHVTAQIIPAISGRVLDAATGEPVKGINVALHASRYEGFSVDTFMNDDKLTGQSGDFQFSRAVVGDGSPLSNFRGYWLTMNTDKGDSSGTDENTDQDVFYNPMANRRGQSVGNKKYFPLTIEFTPQACANSWNATCVYENPTSGLSIQLIPVIDDVKDCKQMENNSLQERCRQLNTYRAAFVHVDSYEEVKKGRELCNEVDGRTILEICLWELELYVANPAYERPIKPQVNEPIPDGMFPESLAGLPVTKNKHCGPRLEFSGRVMCAAGYGTETEQLVDVLIEEWPESEPSTAPPPWNPSYRDHEHATVTEELRPHGKILRYHGPQCNSFFWYSGDRHVEVLSCYLVPQLEQFVSYYLAKFPSTFQ